MNISRKDLRTIMSRVDTQVSLLVVIFTLCATIITSVIFWNVTFQVMIVSLEERVDALYHSIESTLDRDTFTEIESAEDMDTELYQEAKEQLLQLKNGSGVLYLYTAKEDENGDFIYVIDGLEADQDFRYPGDAIEEEISDDMHLALSGEAVIPQEIMHTEWGDIFVAYLPVHDEDGEILGVVGIEFDASVIYSTYQDVFRVIPVIIIVLSVLAGIISVGIFKRISNPFYMDLSTKDIPTGLKNRNAYEVDMNNMMVRGQMENTGIIMIDLNGLKAVNDVLGHNAGDDYISLVARCIKDSKDNNMIAYRIGGDEFVILVQDATPAILDSFIKQCSEQIKGQTQYPDMQCSVSCGYSMFDATKDKSLDDTYHRADFAMYRIKDQQKSHEI